MFDNLKGYLNKSNSLLQNAFSSKFIAAFKSKSMFLPETALRKAFEYRLSDSKIRVKEFRCSAEGIDLTLDVPKYGATLAYTATLVIDTLEVSSDSREAVIRVTRSKLTGDKLWGKVISSVVEAIFNDITATAIDHMESENTIRYDSKTGLARVNLYGFSVVEKLYQELPKLLNKRIIDIVQIKGCDHEAGGLIVRLNSFLGQ